MPDLKELLGEDLFNQVNTKLGENKIAVISDGSYIPKLKFDEVIQQKNTYKTQSDELNTQLETLKKANKGNEDFTKQITELQGKLQEAEIKNKNISLESAIRLGLTKANAKYEDLLLGKVDKSKLEINADGSIKGLDEQINGLKEGYKDLFGEAIPSGSGGNPAGGGGNFPKDPSTMSMTEYADWYNSRNKK